MSWNTSAILISSRLGNSPEQYLAALGAHGGEFVGGISFDEAASSSLEGRAVAVVEDWALIFDPIMFRTLGFSEGEAEGIWPLALEDRLKELSQQHEIASFLLSGSSGTAGFARFKDGQQARCFLYQGDEQLKDVGAASAEEQQSFSEQGDEEQAVLSLVEKLTVDWGKVAAAEFAQFQFDEF